MSFKRLLICSFVAVSIVFNFEQRELFAAKGKNLRLLDKKPSYFTPKYDENQPRSYTWMPLLSFVIPGVGQAKEKEYGAFSIYFSTAVAGLSYSSYNNNKLSDYHDSDEYKLLSDDEKDNRKIHGELERKVAIGSQLYMAMGSMSAYHSFRTAVATRQRYGEFTFLTKEETPWELATAPFQFRFLKRPSTYIPLGIIAGYYLLLMNAEFDDDDDMKKDALSNSDVFYSGAVSYMAGVHEEALFRGWMMPCFMEWTGSELWSNGLTAATFALAHLGTVNVPLPQLILGWHLGNVTQNNDWTLSESIFIHAWWDVFALLASYQLKKNDEKAKLPVIWAPPLKFVF